MRMRIYNGESDLEDVMILLAGAKSGSLEDLEALKMVAGDDLKFLNYALGVIHEYDQ